MAKRDLADYTIDELNEMPYDDILELRARAYRAHVAEMSVPQLLQDWAARMAKRYGSTVRVWKQTLPWLEALMVVRYGEAITDQETGAPIWPSEFSDDDVKRAIAWHKGRRHDGMKGSTPQGVSYLDGDDSGFFSVIGLAVTAVLGAHKLAALLTLLGLGSIGGALTNYLENKTIDWLFRNRQTTAPSAIYIALYTAAPGETGGGTEVSGGSYARVSAGVGATTWQGTGGETTATDSAGTGGATQNINVITFPAPTGSWGTVTHIAALDASTSGNFYWYAALTNSKNISSGDPAPYFPAGSLVFTLD